MSLSPLFLVRDSADTAVPVGDGVAKRAVAAKWSGASCAGRARPHGSWWDSSSAATATRTRSRSETGPGAASFFNVVKNAHRAFSASCEPSKCRYNESL
jgi:hypothetical protein